MTANIDYFEEEHFENLAESERAYIEAEQAAEYEALQQHQSVRAAISHDTSSNPLPF